MGRKQVSEGIIDIPVRGSGEFGRDLLWSKFWSYLTASLSDTIVESDLFPKSVDQRLHNEGARQMSTLIRRTGNISDGLRWVWFASNEPIFVQISAESSEKSLNHCLPTVCQAVPCATHLGNQSNSHSLIGHRSCQTAPKFAPR